MIAEKDKYDVEKCTSLIFHEEAQLGLSCRGIGSFDVA